ncbi:hypothetical protein F2P81_020523 [Scophthalmus maximus]|uniref:MCM8/REC winged helix domain-containing protein n=1 Tax=Scophthalmus maximus TaxID=52904 RepID=A0A6A4SAA2_SCOMX|nr:hypothetical protein F2P81_020523 [Scophthalmus maximus]
MSHRGAGKRLINALHSHAQRTSQKQFDLQTLRTVADRLNIKVMDFEVFQNFQNKSMVTEKPRWRLYVMCRIGLRQHGSPLVRAVIPSALTARRFKSHDMRPETGGTTPAGR